MQRVSEANDWVWIHPFLTLLRCFFDHERWNLRATLAVLGADIAEEML